MSISIIIYNSIFALFYTTFFSCKEKVKIIPEPIIIDLWETKCDSTLKLIWQKSIAIDSTVARFCLYNESNNILYYNARNNFPEKIGYAKLDKNEFSELWSFEKNTLKDIGVNVYDERIFEIENDKLVYTDWKYVYCLNENGELVWKNKFDDDGKGFGGPYLSNFKEKIFYPSTFRDNMNGDLLFDIDLETGNDRLIFEEPLVNFMQPSLEAPVGYIINNDTIATFQIRKYSLKDNHNRVDIVAWNVSKKDTLWRLDSLDRYGSSSSNPLLYEDNKVYYAASFDIYCLNATTGEINWRQSFDSFHYQFQYTNLLLTERGLVVKSTNDEIAMLDKNTGSIIWENRDVGANCSQLTEYNGDIYMITVGDGKIECINGTSGIVKWKAKSPNNCIDSGAHYGLNKFVIDPKENLLFISDNYFLQCFELPDG